MRRLRKTYDMLDMEYSDSDKDQWNEEEIDITIESMATIEANNE